MVATHEALISRFPGIRNFQRWGVWGPTDSPRISQFPGILPFHRWRREGWEVINTVNIISSISWNSALLEVGGGGTYWLITHFSISGNSTLPQGWGGRRGKEVYWITTHFTISRNSTLPEG